MERSETIQCPFCGQRFQLVVDTSAGSHVFTTDCQICCRPLEVSAECEAADLVSVAVLSG